MADQHLRPDVSVIVTAYNVERYITRALESALAQEGVSLEVIVVDDASTDGTWDMISAMGDPRLKAIRLPQNGGPGAARNAAIRYARGRWLAVLDGDDAYAPGRLACCVKRGDTATADIVADNITVLREPDGALFPMFPPATFARNGHLDLGRFIEGNLSFMGGYAYGYLKPVFSAAFLERHRLRYDPAIRIGEDYLLFAECLARGAACRLEPSAGYIYTARVGSISHRLRPRDIARISLRDKKFLKTCQLDLAAARAQRRRTMRIRDAFGFLLLVEALKRRRAAQALRALRRAPFSARHLWRPVWARLCRTFLPKTA
jgi:succinoglycan biosynthesis protein ExoO